MTVHVLQNVGIMAFMAAIAATPAQAVLTNFASFTATTAGNINWLNDGTGGNNNTYRSNGTGGRFFTTNIALATNPATVTTAVSIPIKFSYLGALASDVTDVNALFAFTATTSNAPATLNGTTLTQSGLSGLFSITSQDNLTIRGTLQSSGKNLLAGTFTAGAISGTAGADTATMSSNTSVIFSSDFLDFSHTNGGALNIDISGLISKLNVSTNGGLNATATKALRSFRASTTSGSFAANPAPTAIGVVPEPQSWALLIAGFGLVGVVARRRAGRADAAA